MHALLACLEQNIVLCVPQENEEANWMILKCFPLIFPNQTSSNHGFVLPRHFVSGAVAAAVAAAAAGLQQYHPD